MATAVHKPPSWGTGRTLLLAAGGGLTAGTVFIGLQGEDAPHACSNTLAEVRFNRLQLRALTCQGNMLLPCSLVLWVIWVGMCCANLTCGSSAAKRCCCIAHCLMR